MTDEDQVRVLQMVADGTISAEDGGNLLDALRAENPIRERPRALGDSSSSMAAGASGTFTAQRSLVIQVTEDGESRVNVRIPLGLARAATHFIPRQVQEQLDEYGLDLKDLLADLGQGVASGPLVEVNDENDSSVRIAVE